LLLVLTAAYSWKSIIYLPTGQGFGGVCERWPTDPLSVCTSWRSEMWSSMQKTCNSCGVKLL